MKHTKISLLVITLVIISLAGMTQDRDSIEDIVEKKEDHIQTIFGRKPEKRVGGYLAFTNSFTSLGGDFANLTGIYGGVFINRSIMIGIGASASTNYLPVPTEFATLPNQRMSYEYGQVGLMTEYIIASNRSVHAAFNLMVGSGFTLQYVRPQWPYDHEYPELPYDHDQNWFLVIQPGIQLEFNLFRWMRFSPGISYRITQHSEDPNLSDKNLSGLSIDLTCKFGWF